eukprot:NODE_550_length_6175_cov_0.398453.p2 type:complete len:264 gc:universal NODE_550_length_6175_cov_0.398453:5233-4442(-)
MTCKVFDSCLQIRNEETDWTISKTICIYLVARFMASMTLLICEWGNSCGKECKDPGELYKHCQEHCNEQDEASLEWPCQWKGCGVTVDRKYRLISHLLTHTPYRPYSCKYCQRSFKRSHDMKKHIRLSHPQHSMMDDLSNSDTMSIDSESMDYLMATQRMTAPAVVQNYGLPNRMHQMKPMQSMQSMQQAMQMQAMQNMRSMQTLKVQQAPKRIHQNVYQERSPDISQAHLQREQQRNPQHDQKLESLVQRFMAYTPPTVKSK